MYIDNPKSKSWVAELTWDDRLESTFHGIQLLDIMLVVQVRISVSVTASPG